MDKLNKPITKVFDLSSLLPEIKTYHLSNNNNNIQPPSFQINNNVTHKKLPRIRTALTTKKKHKIPSLYIKHFSTIPRPDVLHCYLSHGEIMQYMDYLKVRFVDFVKIHTLGLSFERRPIKCVEINWNSDRNIWAQAKENRARSAPIYNTEHKQFDVPLPEKGRNIVFIEGGTHAREWISITVALNCIHQLTEKNVRHRDLLRKLKFYIVPLVNPDGYEYTRNVNPRWRKNRRPHSNGDSVGTDCNRNFDFHWDECRSKAKRNTYQGEKPFSEPETRAIATTLQKLAPKLLFFLSLHSYAQSIMYPWGYTKLLPKNAKLMESVAAAGRNAIKTFSGRYYRVGSISQITKRTIAGSVVDYAYGAIKIPLTLVMELPANEYGFQPPSDKINALGNESWYGIREMCKKAYSLRQQIENEEKSLHIENKLSIEAETENSANVIKSLNVGENEQILANSISLTASSTSSNGKAIKCVKVNITKNTSQRMIKGYIATMLDVMF